MKNSFAYSLVLFFLSTLTLNAQEIKYSDLNAQKSYNDKFTSYVSKDGTVYKVGDKIIIGFPSSTNTFAFITETTGGALLWNKTQLWANASGAEVEIIKIVVTGSKRTGFSVSFRTKGTTVLTNYTVQVENAIATGEIKSFGMTSDEALIELKKAKDKLDLEIITQEEYDKIKADLMKYIK